MRSTNQSAIVLTTHNMLECEAICTRIGVMKNGELTCIGDSQHLRSHHGTGFLLEITMRYMGDRLDKAKAFVENTFPGAALIDEHGPMLNYEIPKETIPKVHEYVNL